LVSFLEIELLLLETEEARALLPVVEVNPLDLLTLALVEEVLLVDLLVVVEASFSFPPLPAVPALLTAPPFPTVEEVVVLLPGRFTGVPGPVVALVTL